MRRMFTWLLAIGVALLLGGGVALAHDASTPADDEFENDEDPKPNGGVDELRFDTSDIEKETEQELPAGAVVAGGVNPRPDDPSKTGGYLFVDGNGENGEPLSGYVGLNSSDDTVLVGDTSGHFHRGGGNSSPAGALQ